MSHRKYFIITLVSFLSFASSSCSKNPIRLQRALDTLNSRDANADITHTFLSASSKKTD